VVLPIVHKIPSADGSLNAEYYRVLEDTLTEMSLSLGGFNKAMAKLSPREVEISRMIKTGATTKEVAQALNLSIKTVNKHRQNIRRKLVITKKGVNLTSLLGEGGE
jgi:DNA-binding CsgD family transcriptional regulator